MRGLNGFATTLDGKVDDVRIYHQALAAEAIQLIMDVPTVEITGVPTNPLKGTQLTVKPRPNRNTAYLEATSQLQPVTVYAIDAVGRG